MKISNYFTQIKLFNTEEKNDEDNFKFWFMEKDIYSDDKF